MATTEEENARREALIVALSKLAEIGPESLVRREELGSELCFERGLPYFSRTLKLFKTLKDSSLDGISYKGLDALAGAGSNALKEFEEIKAFSIQKYPQNAIQMRDQLITNVSNRFDVYYETLTPHIAYSVRKGTDFESLEQQARESLKSIQEARDEQLRVQKTLQVESNEILESIRRAAAEAGVSQHSIYFKDEAVEHQKAADIWLKATAGIGAGALGLAILSIYFYASGKELTSTQSLQLAIAKIVAFSILYFGLVWAGRNYRAHRHNYVINKHRQNALSTFQAFIKAAGEDLDTKNAVLIKSTEAIFSPSITGYLHKEPEAQNTQILEVIRSSMGKSAES